MKIASGELHHFLKLNAHPVFLKGWASDVTAGNGMFSEIAFINLVRASRFGDFRVGLLIASQESIAIGLRGPTPHGS